MGAQQAITQAVKSAYPHTARINRQHRGQPRDHFLRRLIGKSHRQYAVRRDMTAADQISDTGGQHARLAAARPRQYQRGLCGQGHRLQLRGIEAG